MRKFVLAALMALPLLVANAQTAEKHEIRPAQSDPNNPYLVWTNNMLLSDVKEENTVEEPEKEDSTALGFLSKNFPHKSLCDWEPDLMKFMVIPDKKDMVIRTFTNDSTGKMVSSMTLRHKVMVYKGHTRGNGLHDRIMFQCEDDGQMYYYEVPTATFDEYCYTKFGIPTLAYLGDVDKARATLVGKTLLTNFDTYNVDVSNTTYGYAKQQVKKGTEVTVVAAGVGTRNYPVKLIVEDGEGNQFFQTVAISRTNSGMRDDEFEADDDHRKHTFEGSFILMGDMANTNTRFQKLIGREYYTNVRTHMIASDGTQAEAPRFSNVKILGVQSIPDSKYARLTLLYGDKEYHKDVTFSPDGITPEENADFFYNLFVSGNLGDVEGVKPENMPDIRKGVVKNGFNMTEVKMALGSPDSTQENSKKGEIAWVYKANIMNNHCIVFFDSKTKKVKYIKKI